MPLSHHPLCAHWWPPLSEELLPGPQHRGLGPLRIATAPPNTQTQMMLPATCVCSSHVCACVYACVCVRVCVWERCKYVRNTMYVKRALTTCIHMKRGMHHTHPHRVPHTLALCATHTHTVCHTHSHCVPHTLTLCATHTPLCATHLLAPVCPGSQHSLVVRLLSHLPH